MAFPKAKPKKTMAPPMDMGMGGMPPAPPPPRAPKAPVVKAPAAKKKAVKKPVRGRGGMKGGY